MENILVRHDTPENFVDEVLASYSNVKKEFRLRGRRSIATLPTLVGAGISCGAKVPLNSDLIERCRRHLELEFDDYAGIEEQLLSFSDRDPKMRDIVTFQVKQRFRDILNAAGVPRERDDPLPNVANLLLAHMIQSRILGPIVSLNVDPLLDIALLYVEGTDQPRFVRNVTEFSNLQGPVEEPLVLQPHGTIEEPMSLRFRDEDLFSEQGGISQGVTQVLQPYPGLLCVGVNLVPDVIQKFLEKTLSDRPPGLTNFRLFVPFYGKAKPEELAVCQNFINSYSLKVDYVENVDADRFFELLSAKAFALTQEDRKEGRSTFHAAEPSYILLLCELLMGRSRLLPVHTPKGWFQSFNRRPEIDRVLAAEVLLHAVAAKGPFSYGDLVRCILARPYISRLSERTLNGTGESLRRVIETLVIEETLLCVGTQICPMDSPLRVSRIEEIDRSLLTRNPGIDLEDYARRTLMAVGALASGEDVRAAAKRLQEIENHRADSRLDSTRAVTLSSWLAEASPIESARGLDFAIDDLKDRFRKSVEGGLAARAFIITESGEFLFSPKFDKDAKEGCVRWEPDPVSQLKAYTRDWLHPIIDQAQEGVCSLRILVARRQSDWTFQGAARAQREASIKAGLRALNECPGIQVGELPWYRHDDHMWVLKVDSGAHDSGAVVFPRRHHEQTQCAVKTSKVEDVNTMIAIYEQTEHRYGERLPIESNAYKHVLALTLVDGRTSNGFDVNDRSKVLVCRRRPETHRRHAGVACVPTKIVPETVLWEIVGRRVGWTPEGLILDSKESENGPGQGHQALVFAVESLLAAKLGLANALERGDVRFKAKASVLRTDFSPVLLDEDDEERVKMVNVMVVLESGQEEIPSRTACYDPIEWKEVGEFCRAVKERTAMLSVDGEDVPYLCGGMCVCTSAVLEEWAPTIRGHRQSPAAGSS